VVGKEVLDNALDACEEAEVAPDITVMTAGEARSCLYLGQIRFTVQCAVMRMFVSTSR